MDWHEYAQKFRQEARQHNKDVYFAEGCLRYAETLYQRNLPIIYDQKHLAALLGFDYNYLLGIANRQPSFYHTFFIPKATKSGPKAYRRIEAPNNNLKSIQRWILENILAKMPVNDVAKAYRPGMGIKDNAGPHVQAGRLMRLDIKDFFPSITFKMVLRFFVRAGYSRPVATLLTKICTLNGRLPQGAPTSPALSNLVFAHLDRRLAGYAAFNKLIYTRYADDLVFSGHFSPARVMDFCRKVLAENGFTLNAAKSRVMRPHQRQLVTGLVVNRRLNAPNTLRRRLIQEAYYIKKFGLKSHLGRQGLDGSHVSKLLGRALFVRHINCRPQSILSKAVEVIEQAAKTG